MAKYFVLHHADYEKLGSIDRLVELAKGVRDAAPPGLRWLNSWWCADKELLFCEWEADNEEQLRQHMALIFETWPVETIYPVVWVDPQWYA